MCFAPGRLCFSPPPPPRRPFRDVPFGDLPPDVVADASLYCDFTYWCSHDAAPYSIVVGAIKVEYVGHKALAYGTVVGYVRKLLNEAERKHGREHREFFAVLKASEGERTWLKGMLGQAEREFQERAIKSGQPMESGATPIGPVEVRDVQRSCSLHGTKDSAARKLIVLLTFLAAGRAGEVATLSWDSFRWDMSLESFYFVWNSVKTRCVGCGRRGRPRSPRRGLAHAHTNAHMLSYFLPTTVPCAR